MHLEERIEKIIKIRSRLENELYASGMVDKAPETALATYVLAVIIDESGDFVADQISHLDAPRD